MLRDLLLFLIIIAGGHYGLWLMRGLDGLVRRNVKKAGEIENEMKALSEQKCSAVFSFC